MNNGNTSGGFRIAVLSEIHAFVDSKRSKNSSVDFSGSSPANRNPLTELVDRLAGAEVAADLVVCPGDICNLADIGGFARAWSELGRLKATLKANALIATCGNHDLDSRHLRGHDDDPDPKGALQEVIPPFPFEHEHLNDHFWAKNFVVLKPAPHVLAVIVNSSAYHGGLEKEIEHGRISHRTIKALSTAVRDVGLGSINLLVCHHHPIPLRSPAKSTDLEYIRKGQDLLDSLSGNNNESWLVIHGHRHFPRLLYGAASGGNNPIVLGAGSIGAQLIGAPNQFHLIEVHNSASPEHSSIVGQIGTWSWTESSGWVDDINYDGGLPSICGFGFKGQIPALVDQLELHVGAESVSWNDARQAVPSIDYLTPSGFEQLIRGLDARGIRILFGHDGKPHLVGR